MIAEQGCVRFLAMEYFRVIWNRSFEIFLSRSHFCGARVAGAVTATSPRVAAMRKTLDPASLFESARLETVRAHEPGSPPYLSLHRSNFAIPKSDVAELQYNPNPKWGMGPIPHSGRLLVNTRNSRTREFILLGRVDGAAIASEARALGYAVAPV